MTAAALLGSTAASVGAQQPADSTAKARADSIALVRELERMQGDTSRPAATAATQQGPTNPRLLPDISAIGDFLFDLSPKGSTQEDLSVRLGVREVELAVAANVDPFFRVDFILGVSDAEKIAIEEAYATAVALPAGLQARLGRFHMPFGKQNTTHRAELQTTEYPWVIQRFFGPEAIKGTGLWVSRIFAPFGFYQELQVTLVDALGEPAPDLITAQPANKSLGGLGYSARLRNYIDISESTNIELSGSALTGKRAQPIEFPVPPAATEPNAVNARQTDLGGDLTLRWRPLQEGLYRSFIWQTEIMHQRNGAAPPVPAGATYLGPDRSYTGAYSFVRWQLTRRTFLGGRYDWLQDPESAGATFAAGSVYLQLFPTEFSKLVAAFERTMPSGLEATNRLLFHATFAVGPHRPHPF